MLRSDINSTTDWSIHQRAEICLPCPCDLALGRTCEHNLQDAWNAPRLQWHPHGLKEEQLGTAKGYLNSVANVPKNKTKEIKKMAQIYAGSRFETIKIAVKVFLYNTGTWTWNEGLFLKYTRNLHIIGRTRYARTKQTNLPLTTWKHPWGDCTSWGGGNINSTWSGFSFSPHQQSLTPTTTQKTNHWLTTYSASRTCFWFAGYNAE